MSLCYHVHMNVFIYSIVALLAGMGIAWVIFGRKEHKGTDTEGQAFMMLQQQMAELAKQLDSKMTESRRDMQDVVHTQFSESQKLLREINEQMRNSLLDV